AALAKARGLEYPVGLVSQASGLVEWCGGPPQARVAIVDRAGILQVVREVDDEPDANIESLLQELLAEPAPSAEALRKAQEAAALSKPTARPQPGVTPAGTYDMGALCRTIPAHGTTIWSTKFSPDGKLIVTTDEEGAAKVWEAGNGHLRHTLRGHEG